MRKLTILLAAAAVAASSVGCCGRCRNWFYKGSPCGTAMAAPVMTTPVAMTAPAPAPVIAAPVAAPMVAPMAQQICVPAQPVCVPAHICRARVNAVPTEARARTCRAHSPQASWRRRPSCPDRRCPPRSCPTPRSRPRRSRSTRTSRASVQANPLEPPEPCNPEHGRAASMFYAAPLSAYPAGARESPHFIIRGDATLGLC